MERSGSLCGRVCRSAEDVAQKKLRGRRGAKEVAQKHREEQYADLFCFYALNGLQGHIYNVGRDKLVDCDGHFAGALALDFCQNALQAF